MTEEQVYRKRIKISLSDPQVLFREGIHFILSGEDIIRQIHHELFNLEIPDLTKVELVDQIGQIEFRLVEGSSERIQLEALIAHFVLVGNKLR